MSSFCPFSRLFKKWRISCFVMKTLNIWLTFSTNHHHHHHCLSPLSGYRPQTDLLHTSLSWAFLLRATHVMSISFISLSMHLLHVSRGLPLPLEPCGFHWRACRVILFLPFLNVCPNHFHLRLPISFCIGTCPVLIILYNSLNMFNFCGFFFFNRIARCMGWCVIREYRSWPPCGSSQEVYLLDIWLYHHKWISSLCVGPVWLTLAKTLEFLCSLNSTFIHMYATECWL